MSKKSLTLYCFSPPVMLATFAVEIMFAVYVLYRYKLTKMAQIMVTILICLATFQGAEFVLCGGLGLSGIDWARVGYGAITLLPPLGLHLAYEIAGKKSDYFLKAAYGSAIAFLAYYTFSSFAMSNTVCYANYVIFDTDSLGAKLYGIYYYGWLLTGIYFAHKWASSMKKQRKTALYALIAGYVSFMLPTALVNIMDASTVAAIPSIMCGFAVILAIVLVGKVAPEVLVDKADTHSLRFRLPF
ncbi:TPA: hypothetical protein DIV49_03695 [Candidatus Saccharibacteria bacterium]|nr:hypothetical protein [Candidatus Saccharibacteria bacterium]HRJ90928.1 hypothetical protein [Candidatus Saccharibacteria bacterium]